MSTQKTINYYRTFGSRVGYGVLAGGHKHFGYYGDKHYWYIPHAADAMIDHLASFAKLKPKERVLDAGCGEGRASLRLAEKFGVNVTGIDVVPEALAIAKKRAAATNAAVDYIEGDYNHLPFPDKTFDLVFALETFTHSPDPRKTLREFWRVLKPGGRVVIFDYSIQELETLSPEYKAAFENIATYTNSPSFILIDHEYYKKHLPKWQMDDFELVNPPASAVMPSLRQLYIYSWLPYQLLKAMGKIDRHPNLLISHFAKPGVEQDFLRYVMLRIQKPSKSKK